jgi:sugar lactone lactonase YvrE
VELFRDGNEVLHQSQIEPRQVAGVDRRNLLIRGLFVLDGSGCLGRRWSDHDAKEKAMKGLVATGIVLLVAAPLSGHAADRIRSHTLPGATAFPESIGVDTRSGTFYTGSLIDGAVYRGSLDTAAASVFLPAGSDGRTSVAGVKVDDGGRIWIADAFNGRVLVYDQGGTLLHSFVLAGPGAPTVNDIAFAGDVAYVTDSARPFLYRLDMRDASDPGTATADPWLDVSAFVTYSSGQGPFGVNLNGIVVSPDGKTLLMVQTNTGTLFRVEVGSRAISEVAVRGADLMFGDGLLRVGDSLYVARNAVNEIVRLRLGSGWRTARLESTLTDAALAFPTALAALRGRLLITNAQLDAGANATLPFTILDLPVDAV